MLNQKKIVQGKGIKRGFTNGNFSETHMYFYHPDHLGSSSYISYTDGEIVQHNEYVPFGEVLLEDRNALRNYTTPFLFNAKELDEQTGLYYYGARYYNPKISNWLSVDPLVTEEDFLDNEEENADGSLNPLNLSVYAYAYLNPIKYNDPDGRCPSCFAGALVGAGVEYGSQVASNLIQGKSLNESLTDIDIADVAISAGEGFLTSGTSAVKNLAVKGAVFVGSEIARNIVDTKIEGSKIKTKTNGTKEVVRNTVIGLTVAGASKAVPNPKLKVVNEIKPKQAVKTARQTQVVNRATRINIQNQSAKKLKEARAFNKIVSGSVNSTASGTASETTKRKN